jgi:O-antigen/teichoic acid export membrane protein
VALFGRKPGAQGTALGRRTVFALVTALVGGNIVATVVKMICGVVTARYVEPALMGLFTGIALVQGYIPFLQLGILNGLNRELPYYVGKGDQQRVRDLAAAAQAWALMLGGGVAFILLGVAVWQGVCGRWMQSAGWVTNAVTAFFLFYGTYYLQITFRTRGDFARLALINVLQSVASLALVVLVWWLAFYGLCLRALIVVFVQLALLWHWRPVKVSPRLQKEPFIHLLKIGAPIFAVGQVYAYWGTLDATLLLVHCGTRSLGLYSLAAMASTTVLMLPLALSQVLYPQMAEQYGKTHDIRVIVKSSLRPMAFSFLVMSGLTAVGWFLAPPVVRLLVPKYTDGIAAVQWSLLTAPVMCLQPINNVFNVVKRQDLFAVAIGLGMASYYGSLMWLIRGGPELIAFPQAMLVGKCVFIVASYAGVAWIIQRARKA